MRRRIQGDVVSKHFNTTTMGVTQLGSLLNFLSSAFLYLKNIFFYQQKQQRKILRKLCIENKRFCLLRTSRKYFAASRKYLKTFYRYNPNVQRINAIIQPQSYLAIVLKFIIIFAQIKRTVKITYFPACLSFTAQQIASDWRILLQPQRAQNSFIARIILYRSERLRK